MYIASALHSHLHFDGSVRVVAVDHKVRKIEAVNVCDGLA